MRGLLRSGNTNSLGLIDAAQNGDIERVKAKLKAGKDVNSRDEACFVYASHEPQKSRSIKICVFFLSLSLAPPGPQWGQMPLLWAAYQGHLEVAELLVESGADLMATDKVHTSNVPLRLITIPNDSGDAV